VVFDHEFRFLHDVLGAGWPAFCSICQLSHQKAAVVGGRVTEPLRLGGAARCGARNAHRVALYRKSAISDIALLEAFCDTARRGPAIESAGRLAEISPLKRIRT
jgi:hypothetical protein